MVNTTTTVWARRVRGETRGEPTRKTLREEVTGNGKKVIAGNSIRLPSPALHSSAQMLDNPGRGTWRTKPACPFARRSASCPECVDD